MEIKKATADQFQDIRLFYHHVIDGIGSLYSDYRQAVS